MEELRCCTSFSIQPQESAMRMPQTPALATRFASLLSSLAGTALIVGSQLGIAELYTRQADAVPAAKVLHQPVAQYAASVPLRRS
jgi:hypothetical protein